MNVLSRCLVGWFRLGLCAVVLTPLSSVAAGERDGLVIPYRKVSISSPVQGLVSELLVESGDTVEKGQVIARLQDDEERFELRRLEFILEKRLYDANSAERLLADKLMSAEEALEKRIELEVSKVQFATAEFALARKQIRTPLEGVIVARHRESGEWVNPGEVLFEVVLMDPIHVEVLLDGREGIHLRRGGRVEVHFPDLTDLPAQSAVIDFVDPRIDASSGLMEVRILVENPTHRILPGMQGKVAIPLPRHSAQL